MKVVFIWLIVLVTILSLAVLGVGCKEEASQEEEVTEDVGEENIEEEAVEEEEPAEEAAEPITITIWTWQTHELWGQWHNWVKEQYEAMNPNVTIEVSSVEQTAMFEQLKAAIAGGEAPDLYGVHPAVIQQFIDAGALLDLTDTIKGDAEWSEWIEPCFGYDDMLYGPDKDTIYFCPDSVNHWGIFYYKDDFPNGFPATLEDFYTDADRLNQEGIIPMDSGAVGFPLSLTGQFMVFYYQMDPEGQMIWDVTSGKIPWDNDVFKKPLAASKALFDKGVFPEDFVGRSWGEISWESFLAHEAASFWFGGSWWAYSLPEEDMANDNVGWANMPAIDSTVNNTVWLGGTGDNKAVNPDGKNIETALDVLKFMVSYEAQEQMIKLGADIPPGSHMFVDEDGNLTISTGNSILDAMIAAQGSYTIKYGYIPENVVSEEAVTQMTNLYLGDATIDDVIAALQAKTDEVSSE